MLLKFLPSCVSFHFPGLFFVYLDEDPAQAWVLTDWLTDVPAQYCVSVMGQSLAQSTSEHGTTPLATQHTASGVTQGIWLLCFTIGEWMVSFHSVNINWTQIIKYYGTRRQGQGFQSKPRVCVGERRQRWWRDTHWRRLAQTRMWHLLSCLLNKKQGFSGVLSILCVNQ